MKTVGFVLAMVALAISPAIARGHGGSHSHSSGGYHYTRSYRTHTGTYVRGHYSTNPNHTKRDNWSTRGNRNPFTGKVGTKPPSK